MIRTSTFLQLSDMVAVKDDNKLFMTIRPQPRYAPRAHP